MNIQTVILAGGKGTRLRPISNLIPKPMVVINGKPFLHHQLEFIKRFGISEVLLLVGYLGEQIRDYFGSGKKFGLKIDYAHEESPLGTGGALKNASDKLAAEFLLLNGDTFLPVDYRKLTDFFCRYRKMGVIVVYDNSEKDAPNNIAVGDANLVISYSKDVSQEMTHVDAGAIVLKKDILTFIPEDSVCSLEEEIFCKLIKKKELVAFITNQRFYDMGSFGGLEVIKGVLK